MSNDVAAAEDPYDQGDIDNRIFQTSLSAAIYLARSGVRPTGSAISSHNNRDEDSNTALYAARCERASSCGLPL